MRYIYIIYINAAIAIRKLTKMHIMENYRWLFTVLNGTAQHIHYLYFFASKGLHNPSFHKQFIVAYMH